MDGCVCLFHTNFDVSRESSLREGDESSHQSRPETRWYVDKQVASHYLGWRRKKQLGRKKYIHVPYVNIFTFGGGGWEVDEGGFVWSWADGRG